MMTAIIIPVIYGALISAYRAKASSLATVEPPKIAEMAMDWLRQDIGDAVPPSALTTALAGPFQGIEGKDDRGHEADDLQFYTVAESPLHATGNGEIKFVELTVMTAPNGDHVLVRKVTRDVVSYLNGSAPDPDVEVICRNVSSFSLSYYDGTAWFPTWDSTASGTDNNLPCAVQVTIQLDRPNGNTRNSDGTQSFQYVRIIPIACSYVAYDANYSAGGN